MNFFLLASGQIRNPYPTLGVTTLTTDPTRPGAPVFNLLGNFFQLVIVMAGIYSLWNILLAGFQFINAGGDPKNITKAWDKIWQTIVGLIIAAGSVTIAAVIGYLVFNDATFLITPKIITP